MTYTGGWQGIESAPKDGTRVLVSAQGHLTMIGAWLEHTGVVYMPAWWSNGSPIIPTPDLWQPLPGRPVPEIETCLSQAEQKAQGQRCPCRGSDDYCVCQNVPDKETRRLRAEKVVSP